MSNPVPNSKVPVLMSIALVAVGVIIAAAGGLSNGSVIGGIVVVIVLTYTLDWRVDQRWPDVVRVHRALALGATALVLAIAVTGWKRWAIHTKLYLV